MTIYKQIVIFVVYLISYLDGVKWGKTTQKQLTVTKVNNRHSIYWTVPIVYRLILKFVQRNIAIREVRSLRTILARLIFDQSCIL
jgi:hypothetical protein